MRAQHDAEAQKEDEDRGCDGGTCASFVGFFICLTTFAGVGLLMIIYGPNKILRELFMMIPEEPGWDWYWGLCAFTTASIVTILPIWPPLCMGAGMIFGFWWGALSNFIAIYTAACISICLGRWLLREPVRDYVLEGKYRDIRIMMKVLEDENDSIKMMVLFRFLFIPMFIRNYGPSTLDIPLWKLFVSAIPHSIWISILFASLGATFKDTAELIREGKEGSMKSMRWQQLVIFFVALFVAIALSIYAWGKYEEARMKEEAIGLLSDSDSVEVEQLRRDNSKLRREVEELRAANSRLSGTSARQPPQPEAWSSTPPVPLIGSGFVLPSTETVLAAPLRAVGPAAAGSRFELLNQGGQVVYSAEFRTERGLKSLALLLPGKVSSLRLPETAVRVVPNPSSDSWSKWPLAVVRPDGSTYGNLEPVAGSDPPRIALVTSQGTSVLVVVLAAGAAPGAAAVSQVLSPSDGLPLATLHRDGAIGGTDGGELRFRIPEAVDPALVVACVLAVSSLEKGEEAPPSDTPRRSVDSGVL